MKVALIGYGKMGRAIAAEAKLAGDEIVAIIDPHAEEATHREINAGSLQNADVCIEFSRPDAALQNIEAVIQAKKPLIIGTTGWYDKIPQVEKWLAASGSGALYAQNFSLGMALYLKVLEQAARLVNELDEYDIGGYEMHHNEKVDSPSGTAETIAEVLLQKIERKKTVFYDKNKERMRPDAIHMASIRCGSVPGTHSVFFDSGFDTITLTHEARNRDGWAKGALRAAKWIQGKQGLYHINEML